MRKFKWSVKKIVVLDIQVREKWNPEVQKNDQYAVFKCGFSDRGGDPAFPTKGKKKEEISLMCFEQTTWTKILPGERYSFSGGISFGVGNTFLVVQDAYDSIGIDVQAEESYINTITLCSGCFRLQRTGGSLPRICVGCGRGMEKEGLPF